MQKISNEIPPLSILLSSLIIKGFIIFSIIGYVGNFNPLYIMLGFVVSVRIFMQINKQLLIDKFCQNKN